MKFIISDSRKKKKNFPHERHKSLNKHYSRFQLKKITFLRAERKGENTSNRAKRNNLHCYLPVLVSCHLTFALDDAVELLDQSVHLSVL